MIEMDGDIPRFETPEAYERFAINVEPRSPALAQEARKRAVKLRAELDGAETDVERECLEAMYAYEWTLFKKHNRRQKASYLRREMERVGILTAVDNVISKGKEAAGYHALVAEGMEDMLFEKVVLRHRDMFSAAAVEKSRQRLEKLGVAEQDSSPPLP